MGDKLFKTYNEQMEILRSRGLKVDEGAIRTLETENYYNVINGYKDLFLEISSPEEKFKDGADFDEIYGLYEFDRELRFIFLKQLLKLETNIKSVIAYKFSEKYGHDNYLKLGNFDTNKNNSELQSIMGVISTLQRAISDQSGKHNAITHYITKYGYVPFWVLVSVLTFGNISKFYGILKLQDRQSVAKEFGLQENVLRGYLKAMSIFRNICAHDERLYSTKLNGIEIKAGPIHTELQICKNANGKHLQGTNDVFSLMICIKELLPQNRTIEFSEMIRHIDGQLNKLSSKIHTININDILHLMGLPGNWKEIDLSEIQK